MNTEIDFSQLGFKPDSRDPHLWIFLPDATDIKKQIYIQAATGQAGIYFLHATYGPCTGNKLYRFYTGRIPNLDFLAVLLFTAGLLDNTPACQVEHHYHFKFILP